MHRLFTIPELVNAIIRELAWMQPLVHGPLTVCKLWADIIMDWIWHDVNDLRAIFRLLAPVEEQASDDEDGFYDLQCVSQTSSTSHNNAKSRNIRLIVVQNPPYTEWMGPLRLIQTASARTG